MFIDLPHIRQRQVQVAWLWLGHVHTFFPPVLPPFLLLYAGETTSPF